MPTFLGLNKTKIKNAEMLYWKAIFSKTVLLAHIFGLKKKLQEAKDVG
jgi:hypothetical protein